MLRRIWNLMRGQKLQNDLDRELSFHIAERQRTRRGNVPLRGRPPRRTHLAGHQPRMFMSPRSRNAQFLHVSLQGRVKPGTVRGYLLAAVSIRMQKAWASVEVPGRSKLGALQAPCT